MVERFWDFSVRTYRTPGVPEACLSLQNDYGADVNMLLFCAWTGAAIGVFDTRLFNRASAYSAEWADHVVIPLREARTWMKHTGCDSEPVSPERCMELREDIKSVEFVAEKMQQEALESLVTIEQPRDGKPDRVVDEVVANLMRYLECLDIQPENDVREKLNVMIRAAFPEIDETIIAEAL